MISAQSPVQLIDVSKSFGVGKVKCTAVRHVRFQALPGELVLLLGPSGSGKTTLLSLMSGMIQPTEGVAQLFGEDVRSYGTARLQRTRATRLGFVFQSFLLIDDLSVLENITLVLRWSGARRAEARERSRDLLNDLGIRHLEHKHPQEISHGERQRVAIARAMAHDPTVIFADEPTASLDSERGLQIIQILSHYARDHHACVIVASHDLRIVPLADRVYLLEDGCLREESSLAAPSVAANKVSTDWRSS